MDFSEYFRREVNTKASESDLFDFYERVCKLLPEVTPTKVKILYSDTFPEWEQTIRKEMEQLFDKKTSRFSDESIGALYQKVMAASPVEEYRPRLQRLMFLMMKCETESIAYLNSPPLIKDSTFLEVVRQSLVEKFHLEELQFISKNNLIPGQPQLEQ